MPWEVASAWDNLDTPNLYYHDLMYDCYCLPTCNLPCAFLLTFSPYLGVGFPFVPTTAFVFVFYVLTHYTACNPTCHCLVFPPSVAILFCLVIHCMYPSPSMYTHAFAWTITHGHTLITDFAPLPTQHLIPNLLTLPFAFFLCPCPSPALLYYLMPLPLCPL